MPNSTASSHLCKTCIHRCLERTSAVSEPSPVAAMRPRGPGAYIAARTSSSSACACQAPVVRVSTGPPKLMAS